MIINHIAPLVYSKTRIDGRNHSGKITVRHRGGGNKKKGRFIDYQRNLINETATVLAIEASPTHTARVALVAYHSGILSCILAPEGLQPGQLVLSGHRVPLTVGNHLPLNEILIGTTIHNVETSPGEGGKVARAAGTYALLTRKNPDGSVTVKLPSGEMKVLPGACTATIGITSNIQSLQKNRRKAGQTRLSGRRPEVRGVAMNPVDHPHGGGEGKSGPGRPSVSPKGIPTKGRRTRKNKRTTYTITKRKIV